MFSWKVDIRKPSTKPKPPQTFHQLFLYPFFSLTLLHHFCSLFLTTTWLVYLGVRNSVCFQCSGKASFSRTRLCSFLKPSVFQVCRTTLSATNAAQQQPLHSTWPAAAWPFLQVPNRGLFNPDNPDFSLAPRLQARTNSLSSATSSGYISGWESLVKCHCVLTTHSWHTGVRWWCVLLHSTFLFSFQNVNLLKIGFLKKVLFVLTNESALGQLQCKIMVLI